MRTADADAGPTSDADVVLAVSSPSGLRLVDAAGQLLIQLTTDPRDSYYSWSPDGRRLVFQRGNETRVVDADGTDERLLFAETEHTCGLSTGAFTWSPDGRRLVQTRDACQMYEVRVIDADGTNLHSLGEGLQTTWSPDSALLAVQGRGLYVFPAEGGDPLAVSEQSLGGWPATWSPDSNEVAFAGAEGLTVLTVASGEQRTLVPGDVQSAVWSPDGAHIAYRTVNAAKDPAAHQGPEGLSIFALDGSPPRTLAATENASVGTWSPDGTRLSYVVMSEVHVASLSGEDVSVAPTVSFFEDPANISWSPGGSLLAFNASTESTGSGMFVVNSDGSNLRRITDATSWGTAFPPVAIERPVPATTIPVSAAAVGASPDGCPPPTEVRPTHGTRDYINFVRLGDVTYHAANFWTSLPDTVVLGEPFTTVCRELNAVPGLVDEQDRDAAFLPVGTSVFSINGHDPRTVVAAEFQGEMLVFEASESPSATKGRDLLDLSAGLSSVRIMDGRNGTELLGEISDPTALADLAARIMAADVDQTTRHPYGGYDDRWFLQLTTPDGLMTVRAFVRSTGEIMNGVLLDSEAKRLIEEGVAAAPGA